MWKQPWNVKVCADVVPHSEAQTFSRRNVKTNALSHWRGALRSALKSTKCFFRKRVQLLAWFVLFRNGKYNLWFCYINVEKGKKKKNICAEVQNLAPQKLYCCCLFLIKKLGEKWKKPPGWTVETLREYKSDESSLWPACLFIILLPTVTQ